MEQTPMNKMTPKQERFCAEYLIDLNATQAAIRAGYSKKTAASIGEENLRKPEIQAKILELMAKKTVEHGIYLAKILASHVAVMDFDIAEILVCDKAGRWSYKPLDEWPYKAKQVCSFYGIDKNGNPIVRIDKHAARESLAKATGVYSDFNQAIACLRNYGLVLAQGEGGSWIIDDVNNESN
jgi:Terminase small subunit